MKFKLKKNEIILLSIFGALLYIFVFYKFIWVPIVPEISQQKTQIAELLNKKQNLETDLLNLEYKKVDLNSKTAQNERLTAYLSDETNVTDCIEYMDKLTRISGSEITGVNITAPEKKEVNQAKYYEIKVDFSTKAKLEKIMNMISYIEGSSKLVKIDEFHISAPVSDKGENTTGSSVAAEKEFNAALTISMYALNVEAGDKFYEYGRHKFNSYQFASEADIFGSESESSATENNDSITSNSTDTGDFQINMNSFLKAGDNVVIIGTDKYKERLSLKTNKHLSMNMSIDSSSYTISISEEGRKSYKLVGAVPDRELNLFINADLAQIPDNKDLDLKIKLINNSDNNINLTLSDKSGRISIFDRDGRNIKEGSDSERLFIR